MEDNKKNEVKKEVKPKSKTTGVKKSTPKKSAKSVKTIKEEKQKENANTIDPKKDEFISKEEISKEVEAISQTVSKVAEKGIKKATESLDKLDEKINNMEKVNINVNAIKDKDSINNLLLCLANFLLLNVKWICFEVDFNGYVSKSSITILHSDMFSLSFLLGISKIFAILSILLFLVIFINTFIKLDSHVPVLKKYNLNANLIIYYNTCYLISLMFTLLGVLYFKDASLTIGYLITLVIFIVNSIILYPKKDVKEKENA